MEIEDKNYFRRCFFYEHDNYPKFLRFETREKLETFFKKEMMNIVNEERLGVGERLETLRYLQIDYKEASTFLARMSFHADTKHDVKKMLEREKTRSLEFKIDRYERFYL